MKQRIAVGVIALIAVSVCVYLVVVALHGASRGERGPVDSGLSSTGSASGEPAMATEHGEATDDVTDVFVDVAMEAADAASGKFERLVDYLSEKEFSRLLKLMELVREDPRDWRARELCDYTLFLDEGMRQVGRNDRAYDLLNWVIEAMDESKAESDKDVGFDMQKYRLLAHRYSIESFWGGRKMIAPYDHVAAEQLYGQLKDATLEDSAQKCVRTEILIYMDRMVLRDMSKTRDLCKEQINYAGPVVYFVMQHAPEGVLDDEVVNLLRMRLGAMVRAGDSNMFGTPIGGDPGPAAVRKAVCYQTALDTIAELGPYTFEAMNEYNKAKFEDYARRAAEGLAKAIAEAESNGADVEDALKNRLRPSQYRYSH